MKKPKSAIKLPPVVNGSSAVRIGGEALKIVRHEAEKNEMTLRHTIETVLVQFATLHLPDSFPGDGKVTGTPKKRRTAKGGVK